MKHNYIKVQDHPNLVRDKNSKAILNVDLEALNDYKRERAKELKIQTMFSEQEQLKADVSEIKDMLKKLFVALDGK